ncbi:MAG: dihydroneopterin aldolase [Polyangiales bacterium]|nr:dihydroneopterin aldolase [Myxococcales bacterium]
MLSALRSDVIAISGLRVDCVVGLYPHERTSPQPVLLDVELALDTEPAAVEEAIAKTVDYHALSVQLAFILENAGFEMLETAAHALARYVLAPPAPGERRAGVEAVRLVLRKPGALASDAVPSLSVTRTQEANAEYGHEVKPFGTVDVIHETRHAGIYRLNVAPGRRIPLHRHAVMREVEMVLTDGLLCQGESARPGSVYRWPHGAAHDYENVTDHVQTILCIDAPRFMEDDEVEVTGERTLIEPDVSRVWVPEP